MVTLSKAKKLKLKLITSPATTTQGPRSLARRPPRQP